MADPNLRPDGSGGSVSLDFDASALMDNLQLPDGISYYLPKRESRLKRFLRRLFRRTAPQRLVGTYKPTQVGVALSDDEIEIKIDASKIT